MKLTVAVCILTLGTSPFCLAGTDSVFAVVSGDSVTVWDMNVRENCASRFKLSIDTSVVHRIILDETDTVGPLANCICRYDVSAVLTGLDSGSYEVDVRRRYEIHYHYDADTTIGIGSAMFEVVGMPAVVFTGQFHQSVCHSADEAPARPERRYQFALVSNYPNPFNPATIISYDLQKSTHVRLSVSTLLGQLVALLVDAEQPAGSHLVPWNAGRNPGGVNFLYSSNGRIYPDKKADFY